MKFSVYSSSSSCNRDKSFYATRTVIAIAAKHQEKLQRNQIY
jgi:hypothetical protein